MATPSDDDRAAMRRQARALATIECDEPGSDESRHEAIAAADRERARNGQPPLKTEVEMHRKAVQRGLVRR